MDLQINEYGNGWLTGCTDVWVDEWGDGRMNCLVTEHWLELSKWIPISSNPLSLKQDFDIERVKRLVLPPRSTCHAQIWVQRFVTLSEQGQLDYYIMITTRVLQWELGLCGFQARICATVSNRRGHCGSEGRRAREESRVEGGMKGRVKPGDTENRFSPFSPELTCIHNLIGVNICDVRYRFLLRGVPPFTIVNGLGRDASLNASGSGFFTNPQYSLKGGCYLC